MSSRRLELLMTFRLRATHSLEEREAPHEHVWRIEMGLTGPLHEGRVHSMPALREILFPAVGKLEGTFLNENGHLDGSSRAYPTCECLASYFEKAFEDCLRNARLESLRLTFIQVTVEELNGDETGSARLTLD